MSTLPIVAIVGRRNVGKSTLFNALIGLKRAIVDSVPGLTRDIISYNVEHASVMFTLADSPGLDLPDSSTLSGSILSTARDYLKKASVIIFLLENPAPADFDMDLADFVRRLSVPVIAAVNKMDGEKQMENMANFYEMGFRDIVPVSAKTHFNLALLLDKIIELLPVKRTARHESDLRITIVGRPNSGKSTLLNSFIGYSRSVVSEIPGTTRDAVDEDFMYRRKRITVIDTAGIRKKGRIREHIEYYSLDRTRQAIERSDVAVHLIDAPAGLTDTDKKISDEIMRLKKPAIIAINKWDLIEKDHATFKSFTDRLIFQFYKAADFPIITVSAKNKLRLFRIIDTAMKLKEASHRMTETSTLNRMIAGAASRQTPRNRGAIKIYYATQVGTAPPRFRFFVNNPAHFRKDTVRYFEKLIQRDLGYGGVPVVIQIQGKK